VAIVDSGRVVATGTPAELKERTGAATLDDVYLHHAGRRFEMAHDNPRDPGAGFPRDHADGGSGGSSPRAAEVTR